MDERSFAHQLLPVEMVDDIKKETILNCALDYDKNSNNHSIILLNSSLWIFSKKGFEELQKTITENGYKGCFMAIIDHHEEAEREQVVAENIKKEWIKLYYISKILEYSEFYEAIQKRLFSVDFSNSCYSKVLLFSCDFSLVWYVDQQEKITKFFTTKNTGTIKNWTICKTKAEEKKYVNNQSLFWS